MITVRWRDVPDEVRSAVAPHLGRWIRLVPTWCQEFRVNYVGSMPGDLLQVHVSYRNRWASLVVGPEWLQQPEAEREVAIIHELVHIALEPLAGAGDRIIGDLTEEGTPLRELADSIFTDGLEAATEDLARAIQRMVPA